MRRMKQTVGFFWRSVLLREVIVIRAGKGDPFWAIASLVLKGWRWEIDYSRAGKEESVEWKRADIAGRAVLAKMEGRPIHFQGVSYYNAQDLEDALVDSGLRPTEIEVDRDDEIGLWLRGATD